MGNLAPLSLTGGPFADVRRRQAVSTGCDLGVFDGVCQLNCVNGVVL